MADLYLAMSSVGMHNPRDVDELELWECASILGLAREEEPAGRDPTAGRDLIAERAAAAREGRPQPTLGPPTGERGRSLPSGRHMTGGRARGRH